MTKNILKFSKCKDSDKFTGKRKKLKDTDLKTHEIKDPLYINDSLRVYYKTLSSRCKTSRTNKLIFGYSASKIRVLKLFSA